MSTLADGVLGSRVSLPADVAEVAAVIADAGVRGESVVASGRGRHFDIGAPLRRCDVVVRLDRLGRVLAHEPGDMTVTVEAGCTLAALDRVLGAAGQWLPIDAPEPEETTVGGLIAANLSGPLRASQGTVRDLLLGIAVVGGGGVVTRGGGRVVKNVAGYDLPKMHIGALGTLGVIVEATFKVRPRFAREAAVMVEVPTLAAACDLALALRDAVEPTWLELVHPAALLDPGLTGACVVAGMGGAPAWVEEAGAAAAQAACAYRVVRHDDGAAIRRRMAELVVRAGAAIVRISTLVTEVGSFVAPASAALDERGVGVDVTAHAVNGVSRLALAHADAVPGAVAELRAGAPAGTLVVVERSRAGGLARLDVWGDGGPSVRLMSGLKRAFDPCGVFAPGRFVTEP